jgi:hypothetical protein
MSAVSAGTRSIAMTNAANMMPTATAKPICVRKVTPESISAQNVPARMMPAEATEGPACSTAMSAAGRGARPSCASSRRRAIMRML